MLNAIGLQGIGVHRFIAEKMPELRARGAVVIVNICGTTLQEYVELATILSDVEGVAALELNISCPNIKEGGITFGCSLHGTADVVAAVRAATRLPVIPKLTPNVTDISAIAKAAEDAGADAVSLVNTFLAMAIDVETRRPRLSNIVGGLSGPAIRPIAVRMVYECRQKIRIPIIGMGGIAIGSRCARVHHRRRGGGAGRHRKLRRPAHLAEASRRARAVTASGTASKPSATSPAQSTPARAKTNGSAPSRARRRQRRPRDRARSPPQGQGRRHQNRQHPVHRRRPGTRASAGRSRAPRVSRSQIPRHPAPGCRRRGGGDEARRRGC